MVEGVQLAFRGILINVLFVTTFLAVNSGSALPPICCFPTQYEAFAFVSEGVVDLPSAHRAKSSAAQYTSSGSGKLSSARVNYGYGYANSTVKLVYDAVTQRTYRHERSVSFLSIYPIPIPEDYLNILDYKNNVQWRVYSDGSCDKLDVGLPLYEECIPGNATVVSVGTLGNEILTTYLFHDRIYLDPYEVTVTVVQSASNTSMCTPIRASMSQAYVFDTNKDVDITVADIVDFTMGIKDPSIFIPPSACNSSRVRKDPAEHLPGLGFFQSLISTKKKLATVSNL